MIEFHDDDTFQNWDDYTCPACGGRPLYCETDCSLCAIHIEICHEILVDFNRKTERSSWNMDSQQLHDETLRRMSLLNNNK